MRTHLLLWLLAAPLVLGCGSGSQGPDRYRVYGTVEYDGKPLPAGRIFFEPDTASGNSGPAGYATITGGAFDTAADDARGTVPGPVNVRIEGYDGEPAPKNDHNPLGTRLFVHRERRDLPAEPAETTFEVPADAEH